MLIIRQQQRRAGRRQRSVQVLSTTAESNHQHKARYITDITKGSAAEIYDTVRYYGWRRGTVVSGVRRMDEVNARRARLVSGWVTVFGQV